MLVFYIKNCYYNPLLFFYETFEIKKNGARLIEGLIFHHKKWLAASETSSGCEYPLCDLLNAVA